MEPNTLNFSENGSSHFLPVQLPGRGSLFHEDEMDLPILVSGADVVSVDMVSDQGPAEAISAVPMAVWGLRYGDIVKGL